MIPVIAITENNNNNIIDPSKSAEIPFILSTLRFAVDSTTANVNHTHTRAHTKWWRRNRERTKQHTTHLIWNISTFCSTSISHYYILVITVIVPLSFETHFAQILRAIFESIACPSTYGYRSHYNLSCARAHTHSPHTIWPTNEM